MIRGIRKEERKRGMNAFKIQLRNQGMSRTDIKQKLNVATLKSNIINMINSKKKFDPIIVQSYIDYVKTMFTQGKVNQREMLLLCEVMKFNTIYLTSENINWILRYFSKTGNNPLAIEKIDDFISLLDKDDDRISLLSRERNEIEKRIQRKERKIAYLINIGIFPEDVAKLCNSEIKYIDEQVAKLISQNKIDRILAQNPKQYVITRRRKVSDMLSFDRKVNLNLIQEHIIYVQLMTLIKKEKQSDIELLRQAIQMDIRFLTVNNIKFIAMYYVEADQVKTAIAIIRECMELLDDYDEHKKNELRNLIKEIEIEAKSR